MRERGFTLSASLLGALFVCVALLTACGVTPPPPPPPPPPPEAAAQQVAVGASFSVAVLEDGTVWSWGHNNYGQLGVGEPMQHSFTKPVPVDGLQDVKSVATGAMHTLALTESGEVWAWGHNNRGQIGLGWPSPVDAETQYYEPVLLDLQDIVAVAASGESSYALDANGSVWAWGNNSHMELGDGTTVSRGDPAKVAFPGDPQVAAIFAGYSFAHAIDTDGNVWFWGDAAYRLGNGSPDEVSIPTMAADPGPLSALGITHFSGSGTHTLGIAADGSLHGWGTNQFGELARPDDVFTVEDPAKIDGFPGSVTHAAAGGRVSLAVSDGVVYSWGTSYFGELGNGTTGGTTLRTPQAILDLDDVVSVAVGKLSNPSYGRHVLALTESGAIYAWGYNIEGQLGTGDTDDRLVPTLVSFE